MTIEIDGVCVPDLPPADTDPIDTDLADTDVDTASPAPDAPPTADFHLSRERPLHIAVDASKSTDDDQIMSYSWDFGDGQVGSGMVAEHTYTEMGCYPVTLTVTDSAGQQHSMEQFRRVISGPESAPAPSSVQGLPLNGAVLPRDLATNTATVTLTGETAALPYEQVVARVWREFDLVQEVQAELCEDTWSLEVPVEAIRQSHEIEVGVRGLGESERVVRAFNIVAGDVIMVTGQSNAVSWEYDGSAEHEVDPFVRSFGIRHSDPGAHTAYLPYWHTARSIYWLGAIGQWPLRMGSTLSKETGIPLAIVNGAHGGKPIGFFQRNDAAPRDLNTNYGRMLDRVLTMNAEDHVRAILFYQGESDWHFAQQHHDGFVALHEDWRRDFADVERFYVTQVRLGCGGYVDTREVQRQFPALLPRTSVMSTTGLDGHDGCHFAYKDGYEELGDRYAALLLRDLYGGAAQPDTEAVDVDTVRLDGDEIRVETQSDASELIVDPGVHEHFLLFGGTRSVSGVTVDGATLVLSLTPGEDPTHVAYVGHPGAGPWVTNAKGVGLLAFKLPL